MRTSSDENLQSPAGECGSDSSSSCTGGEPTIEAECGNAPVPSRSCSSSAALAAASAHQRGASSIADQGGDGPTGAEDARIHAQKQHSNSSRWTFVFKFCVFLCFAVLFAQRFHAEIGRVKDLREAEFAVELPSLASLRERLPSLDSLELPHFDADALAVRLEALAVRFERAASQAVPPLPEDLMKHVQNVEFSSTAEAALDGTARAALHLLERFYEAARERAAPAATSSAEAWASAAAAASAAASRAASALSSPDALNSTVRITDSEVNTMTVMSAIFFSALLFFMKGMRASKFRKTATYAFAASVIGGLVLLDTHGLLSDRVLGMIIGAILGGVAGGLFVMKFLAVVFLGDSPDVTAVWRRNGILWLYSTLWVSVSSYIGVLCMEKWMASGSGRIRLAPYVFPSDVLAALESVP